VPSLAHIDTDSHTLSLHDALPISRPAAPGRSAGATETGREPVSRLLPRNPENARAVRAATAACRGAREDARHAGCAYDEHALLRSEEHTSELQSPYDVVCRLLLEK